MYFHCFIYKAFIIPLKKTLQMFHSTICEKKRRQSAGPLPLIVSWCQISMVQIVENGSRVSTTMLCDHWPSDPVELPKSSNTGSMKNGRISSENYVYLISPIASYLSKTTIFHWTMIIGERVQVPKYIKTFWDDQCQMMSDKPPVFLIANPQFHRSYLGVSRFTQPKTYQIFWLLKWQMPLPKI